MRKQYTDMRIASSYGIRAEFAETAKPDANISYVKSKCYRWHTRMYLKFAGARKPLDVGFWDPMRDQLDLF